MPIGYVTRNLHKVTRIFASAHARALHTGTHTQAQIHTHSQFTLTGTNTGTHTGTDTHIHNSHTCIWWPRPPSCLYTAVTLRRSNEVSFRRAASGLARCLSSSSSSSFNCTHKCKHVLPQGIQADYVFACFPPPLFLP
jgi:hypothetical protein